MIASFVVLSLGFSTPPLLNDTMSTTPFKEFKPMIDGYWGATGTHANIVDLQTISPASPETGKSACNDDGSCWGFVACDNSVYTKSLEAKSGCSVYFSDSRCVKSDAPTDLSTFTMP